MTHETLVAQPQVKKNWIIMAFFIITYGMIIVLITQFINVDIVKGKIEYFVQNYGFVGLFLMILVMDSLTQPISPDIAVFSAVYFTDLNIFTIIIIAGIASGIAGIICYSIGKHLGVKFLSKRFNQNTIEKGEKVMNKYGPWGVFIGAISPIPYDLVCYLSGIFKIKRVPFLLIIFLGRFARFGAISTFTSSVT